ncbi:L-serine dehydratase [Haloechinothrix alba]|uniref:L-serine dehydratase n=1 Tax=Haloechinothrix alba TaxID=664784 RepID=A0A238Y655_9PSEU|nr:L-serine ammonia-lyase [Haloechinothrix alba]SNR66281.1 L-serine dehydratase [Haloechinothrix alba]
MTVSVFDMFSVGIGPSSSHTVGPMRAAGRFAAELLADGLAPRVARLRVALFGSLGATGRGHGSDRAVLLGLTGEEPESVDIDAAVERLDDMRRRERITLSGGYEIAFVERRDLLLYRRRTLPEHPNGMRFTALDASGAALRERTYYSIGGGFVIEGSPDARRLGEAPATQVRYPFGTAAELLSRADEIDGSVSDVVWANECGSRPEADVRTGLLTRWRVMRECVRAGCRADGVLPGGLKVPRRAPRLYRDLLASASSRDTLQVMDWVALFALAVNEQNAAGGRVVTAPTNGAAGIVPAVLHYYWRFVPGANEDGVVRFLLTAGGIGMLFKQNASISGADVGCQGEVGSACSMAAAGLTEVLGGTPAQVEYAAEIALEHNLGLTCDPIGGLVQIPCIERNAVAANKAVTASRLALRSSGTHYVSLDEAIATMRETGADMKTKYKETSRGGLAVNVAEC